MGKTGNILLKTRSSTRLLNVRRPPRNVGIDRKKNFLQCLHPNFCQHPRFLRATVFVKSRCPLQKLGELSTLVVLSGSHERVVHINISRRAYELSKLAVGKRRDAVAGYHGRQVGTGSTGIDLISSVFPPETVPKAF